MRLSRWRPRGAARHAFAEDENALGMELGSSHTNGTHLSATHEHLPFFRDREAVNYFRDREAVNASRHPVARW
jgi:hypothetical protein